MISYPLYLIHQNLAYLIEYNLSIKFNEFPLNFIGGGSIISSIFGKYNYVLFG